MARENMEELRRAWGQVGPVFGQLVARHFDGEVEVAMRASELLLSFRGDLQPDSVAAGVYQVFNDHLLSSLMKEQIPDETVRRQMMDGFYTLHFHHQFFRHLTDSTFAPICTYS